MKPGDEWSDSYGNVWIIGTAKAIHTPGYLLILKSTTGLGTNGISPLPKVGKEVFMMKAWIENQEKHK